MSEKHKPVIGTTEKNTRRMLSVLTPDSVGPLALSCLLAAQGPNPEVRRQGSHAVNQFQSLVSAFPPDTPEGIFLGRLERVAYAAAATMIEADQEAKATIERAQQDYENTLLGTTVKSQVFVGVAKWVVRMLLLMGASLFIARLGLDIFSMDIAQEQRSRTQWLPYAFAFAVPVLIGVGQSLWRIYTATNLVYQRDLKMQGARRARRTKQKAAIRYAKEQARLAWDDFVEPDTSLPEAHPTLDLLHVLHMEELRIKVTPPLSIMLINAGKKRWRSFSVRRKRRKKSKRKA